MILEPSHVIGQDLGEIPDGAIAIFSAHGVSKAVWAAYQKSKYLGGLSSDE